MIAMGGRSLLNPQLPLRVAIQIAVTARAVAPIGHMIQRDLCELLAARKLSYAADGADVSQTEPQAPVKTLSGRTGTRILEENR